MTQLWKTLDYCNDTSTDVLSSLRPMPNFQPHKRKIYATASPPEVTPTVTPPPPLQQQSEVFPTPVKASPYPKADRVVDREICHLYSLKHLVEEDFVYVCYYDDLDTCLGRQLYTKIAWIQDYRSEIYYSMNEAKRDRHHPVWSNVHARFKRNPPLWSVPQYYAWQEVLSKPYIPTRRIPPDTCFGLDYMKPIILFVALIRIDDRYGDGWHELIFEDRFGDGWHD